MAPKLTSMAEGVIIGFAVDDRRRLGKALKSGLAGMAEATMPSSRGGSGHKGAGTGGRRRELQGVERP